MAMTIRGTGSWTDVPSALDDDRRDEATGYGPRRCERRPDCSERRCRFVGEAAATQNSSGLLTGNQAVPSRERVQMKLRWIIAPNPF